MTLTLPELTQQFRALIYSPLIGGRRALALAAKKKGGVSLLAAQGGHGAVEVYSLKPQSKVLKKDREFAPVPSGADGTAPGVTQPSAARVVSPRRVRRRGRRFAASAILALRPLPRPSGPVVSGSLIIDIDIKF